MSEGETFGIRCTKDSVSVEISAIEQLAHVWPVLHLEERARSQEVGDIPDPRNGAGAIRPFVPTQILPPYSEPSLLGWNFPFLHQHKNLTEFTYKGAFTRQHIDLLLEENPSLQHLNLTLKFQSPELGRLHCTPPVDLEDIKTPISHILDIVAKYFKNKSPPIYMVFHHGISFTLGGIGLDPSEKIVSRTPILSLTVSDSILSPSSPLTFEEIRGHLGSSITPFEKIALLQLSMSRHKGKLVPSLFPELRRLVITDDEDLPDTLSKLYSKQEPERCPNLGLVSFWRCPRSEYFLEQWAFARDIPTDYHWLDQVGSRGVES